MKESIKISKGFTLAEILITLSIIGVVAALTIPTLIQRTGNEELVSKLNKAYSTLSQATEAVMTEYGNPKTWVISRDAMYEHYKSHLRISKDCGTARECTYSEKINRLKGGERNGFPWHFILSDGTFLTFEYFTNECNAANFGQINTCGAFMG